MIGITIETGFIRTLTSRADRPVFPLIVAGIALAATLSIVVPFAPLFLGAVLMAPARWKSIVLSSSLAVALGAGLLYLVFHHLGWARLFAAYPDILNSSAWTGATRWLTRYGVAAMFFIAVLPLPLTPALLFAAISRLPVTEVLLALWLGKLVKLTAFAWLASAFPEHFARRARLRVAALAEALSRVAAPDSGRH